MGFALWFTLIKSAKIVDRNFRMSDCNFGAEKRELAVLKRFSYWNKRFLTFLRPIYLSTDWRINPKQERRGRTPLERDLKENSRTGREIIDLLGVFFSFLFSHVVLLFKHESLCNI
jgi:hypothetical protein